LETVQDKDVVTTDQRSTSLSDLQGHSPIANFFKWDFSQSCGEFDTISSDIVRRSFPLR